MPARGMEKPSPNAGDEQEQLKDLAGLLAPRGLTTKPSPEHWKQAWEELPLPEIKQPVLPGLRVGDKPVGWEFDQHMKLVRQRAWVLANGGQVIVTAESMRALRNGR